METNLKKQKPSSPLTFFKGYVNNTATLFIRYAEKNAQFVSDYWNVEKCAHIVNSLCIKIVENDYNLIKCLYELLKNAPTTIENLCVIGERSFYFEIKGLKNLYSLKKIFTNGHLLISGSFENLYVIATYRFHYNSSGYPVNALFYTDSRDIPESCGWKDYEKSCEERNLLREDKKSLENLMHFLENHIKISPTTLEEINNTKVVNIFNIPSYFFSRYSYALYCILLIGFVVKNQSFLLSALNFFKIRDWEHVF